MIAIIDNYDSFTHNLYQYFREITNEEVRVIRNDEISTEELGALKPNYIVISPGPGRPEEAGISIEVIKQFAGQTPILGVCLGHQAIAQAFGARIVQAQRIVHGKVEEMQHDGKGLFRSVEKNAQFTRYHSLAAEESTLSEDFEITCRSQDGEIMGIRHKEFDIEGVQFHPESIASNAGKTLLKNFLNYRRESFDPKDALQRVISGEHMTIEQAESFMTELTEGNLSDIQIAGFLTALNTKGITPEEIAGCAKVLQRKRVAITSDKPLLDTCGTGGDGLGTFNISSLAAIIAASCGVVVAKHGNRAVSSKSGSADFYKAMGMDIDLSPEQSQVLLRKNDFAFLFAPHYHGAMRFAGPARKELKVKTIMNLLGPLANPAGAEYQVMGVYSAQLAPVIAKAAKMLGLKRGLIVHGRDGEDEISVSATSLIVELKEDGSIIEYEFDPFESCGIKKHGIEDLIGGDAKLNAELARQVLGGQGIEAIRDAVCLNAGAALYVYGISQSIPDGFEMAKNAIASGKASRKIEDTVFITASLKNGGTA